jgi:hypothetical protein
LSRARCWAAPDPGEAPAIRTLGLGPFALVLPREARDDMRRRIEADMQDLRRNRAEIGRSLWRCAGAAQRTLRQRGGGACAGPVPRGGGNALQAQGHGALLDTLEHERGEDRGVGGRSAGARRSGVWPTGRQDGDR